MTSGETATGLQDPFIHSSQRVALAMLAIAGERRRYILGGLPDSVARIAGLTTPRASSFIYSMHTGDRGMVVDAPEGGVMVNPDHEAAVEAADAEFFQLDSNTAIGRAGLVKIVETQIAAEQALEEHTYRYAESA